MKKIILAFLFLIPSVSYAATSVPWIATSTPSSFISPAAVNGINQAIKINGDATSTINKLDVGILNVPILTTTPTGQVNISGTGNCLTVATSAFIVDCTNNRVGIAGTTTPGAALSINSSTTREGGIALGDQAIYRTGASSLRFESAPGVANPTWTFRATPTNSTAAVITAFTGGGYAMYGGSGTNGTTIAINSTVLLFLRNSRLGINNGTTDPTNTLDVNGNASIGAYRGIKSAPSNSLIVSGFIGTGTSTPWANLSVASFGGTTPQFIVASSTGSNATTTSLIVDTFGNVGIASTSPSQALSVQGNGLFSGDISAANIIATGTIQALTGYKSADGTDGFTGSGTSCTITAIKNGLITAAVCTP